MRRLLSRDRLNAPGRSVTTLRRVLALAALLSCLAPVLADAASFDATLDTDTVTVGESATLTLKFDGANPRSFPKLPDIPNVRIEGGGTSRSYSLVNGSMSATYSESFSLTPTQPGVYTIPALRAEVNGQIVMSQPLTLKAVKPGSPAGSPGADQLAFFQLIVPKKEVFVGEVLTVELRVFIRDGIANAGHILDEFDQFGGSPLKAEGFSVLKTATCNAGRHAATTSRIMSPPS